MSLVNRKHEELRTQLAVMRMLAVMNKRFDVVALFDLELTTMDK